MSVLVNASSLPAFAAQIGPFLSGGNLYAVLVSSNTLLALKGASPPTSFTEQDAAHHPTSTNNIGSYTVRQVGTNLHVLSADSDGGATTEIRYSIFSMSSDTWTTSGELVQSAFNDKSLSARPVGLEVLSSGVVVALYQGARVRSHGNYYARVVYNKRTSGTWGGPVAVDVGGDYDYYSKGSVLGASDRVHFFFEGNPPGYDLIEKSLSGSTLSAEHVFNGDANMNTGAGAYDATNDHLYVATYGAVYTAASSASSSWSRSFGVGTGHGWNFYNEDNRNVMAVALDAATNNAYVLWISDVPTPNKEWWSHNTAAASTTWTTDTDTGLTPTSTGGVSVNVIQRGSDYFFAFLHPLTVGGTAGIYYDEIQIGVILGAASLSGTGSMTVAGNADIYGAATMSGVGSSAIAGTASIFGAASLSGAGSLTATGTLSGDVLGAASLSGTGSLSAAGVDIKLGAVSLSGTGSLSSSGVLVWYGAADLSGTGMLSSGWLQTGIRVISISVEEDEAGNPVYHVEAMQEDLIGR